MQAREPQEQSSGLSGRGSGAALRAATDALEARLAGGAPVSQEDWDKLADMFDDADEEPPLSPAMLEAESPQVDGRLRSLIRDAFADLSKDKK